MAVWYHIETTTAAGVTWRSTQPIPSWEAVKEWVERAATAYDSPVVRLAIQRYADPDNDEPIGILPCK